MADLRRNAEGYADPTAGEALQNIVREEKANRSIVPKVGEVWETKKNGDSFLIIAKTGDKYLGVKVFDCPSQDNVRISSGQFVDPVKINYLSGDYLIRFRYIVEQLKLTDLQDRMHSLLFGEPTPRERTYAEKYKALMAMSEHSPELHNYIGMMEAVYYSARGAL